MPSTIEITHLSKEEKLMLMESIWEDLSKDPEEVESPEWHQEVLRETERRLKAGQEKILNWEDAKRSLREAQ